MATHSVLIILTATYVRQQYQRKATILRYCLSCSIIQSNINPKYIPTSSTKFLPFSFFLNTGRDRQEKVGWGSCQKIGIFTSVSIFMRVALKDQVLLSEALQV